MRMTRLYDLYPDIDTDGIFTDLAALPSITLPWEDDADALVLDFAYGARSASKIVSPILKRKSDGEPLTAEARANIALVLYTLHHKNWEKLYNTLSLQYNPISNYDMTEEESVTTSESSTDSDTGTVANAKTGSDTETGTVSSSGQSTDSGTVGTSGSSSGENGIYGFNSSESVGSDDTQTTSSSTETRNLQQSDSNTDTHNLTFGHNTTDTETRNLSREETRENEVSRSLSRSGNIGVTTSQQMITSEREVWQWVFFDKVFSDIDSFLTIPIY